MSEGNKEIPPLSVADLKVLMTRHLVVAQTLKGKGKCGMVAYHLGYGLEFALKACICKHLNQSTYPTGGEDGKFFKSHSFQRLYLLSGLQDLFDRGRSHGQVYDSFVQEYFGDDWTKMRYDTKKLKYLGDKRVAKRLYNTLVGHGRSASKSIIGVIKKEKRW